MSPRWLIVATTTTALLALGAMTDARAWEGPTHGQMTDEAIPKGSWVDRYQDLQPTPFEKMVEDTFPKNLLEADPKRFRFFSAKTKEKKSKDYKRQTESMDPKLRSFARRLLLSEHLEMPFELGEGPSKGVSARQILAAYAKQPDDGMDRVDASWHQVLTGGSNIKQLASQGFRHMLFFLGLIGEAPKRAELFMKLGQRAIAKGHPYWGFRLIAWGLHYLQDMSMPSHTKALPTLKLIAWKKLLTWNVLKGLGEAVKDTSNTVMAHHYPYEKWIGELYDEQGAAGKMLSEAIREQGLDGQEVFRGSIRKIARRLARSRKSAKAISRELITLLGDQASITEWRTSEQHQETVREARNRLKTTRNAKLLRAEQIMVRKTVREFRRAGVATRQAMKRLQRQLER